jgi:hypothetical protein
MATAPPLVGISVVPATAGVRGQNTSTGAGVLGESNAGRGVYGRSASNYGVSGDSTTFPGVRGTSVSGRGVEGWSTSDDGVFGISTQGIGVHGVTESRGRAVVGESKDGVGVHGLSQTNEGMHAETSGPNVAAMVIIHHSEDSGNAALFASKKGDRGHAGFFEGNVHVTRDLSVEGEIWANAGDCAEDFDIADLSLCEPGTVMVIGPEGALHPSQSAYDRRVVGVVSGAGSFRPAIVLDKQQGVASRRPIALMGKVFCKVDATLAPVRVGDLLVSASVPGHAMRATDTVAAFGAVIGKALRPLEHGRGLVPILVTLQ